MADVVQPVIYRASLDKLAKGMTLGVVFILLLIGQVSFRALINFQELNTTSILVHAIVLTFLIGILFITYLFSPQYYQILGTQLQIKRPIGLKRIDLNKVKTIRPVRKGDLKGTIRTAGSGGLFGYFGRFYNRSQGHMTYFVTQRKNLILIEMETGKKIVISPDDPGLLHKLNRIANPVLST